MRAGRWVIGCAVGALLWTVGPSAARADFNLLRQCETPTATVWWTTALYEDDANTLFRQENFPSNGMWPAESALSPGIRDCFGTGTPHEKRVLLHWVLRRPDATSTQAYPILLVPGAGDNGKRVFTFMAYALAFEGYNVFTLTFAQPNGDNFQHAEQISNALEAISGLYGGTQVDVVAHSMGGLAAWIYASNDGSVEWGSNSDTRGAAYSNLGTRYRGDIRRLVFLGTPLGGQDTVFRWPNVNYTRVTDTAVNAPISWDTYYPLTSGNQLVSEDFTSFGYFAEQDYYPGQAQSLRRMDEEAPLPGTITELGLSAYQQDWYTTYEGGYGLYSYSRGIDEAIDRGGRVMDKLAGAGVDPAIDVYLGLGLNPILPLEQGAIFTSEEDRATYGETMESDYPRLKREWLDPEMPWNAAWGTDVQSLFEGRSAFGELSAPSDGIVMEASATATGGVTSRGAELIEVHRFEALNHLELTYAGRLAAYFFGEEEVAGELFDLNAAAKYDAPENQVVEWVDRVLDTPVEPPVEEPDAGVPDDDASTDVGGTDGDDADTAEPDADTQVDADAPDPAEADVDDGAAQTPRTLPTGSRSGCAVAPASSGSLAPLLLLLGGLLLLRR